MREGWKKYRIGEIATVVGGGTPSTKIGEYYGGNIPWLTPKDLSNNTNKYVKSGSRNITKLGLEKSSAKLLPKGTVLFTSRAPIGYVAIAQNEIATNQGFKSLICDEKIAYNEYIYYLLKSKVKEIENIATGSTFKEVSGSVLKEFEIILPPLPIQKKIARTLSALDDKIELNRQMNRTLEATAQTIFKSWFVDFDPVHAKAACRTEADYEVAAKRLGISREVLELFPDEFEESELGMIPKGWEIVPYIDEISLTGGGTPKRSEKSYWNGNIPWFSVKDVPEDGNIFVIDTSEKITEEGLKNSSTKLIPTNTTIITARGTVGKLALVGVDMAMNQSCYAVSNKNNFSFFEYFRLKRLTYELKRKTHGAVFDTITTATFKAIKTTKIPNEIVKEFEKIIYPVIMQIKNNLKEIQTLQQTRDTLLPKLLSGELDVSRQ